MDSRSSKVYWLGRLALFILLALVLALAACGGGTKPAPATAASQPPASGNAAPGSAGSSGSAAPTAAPAKSNTSAPASNAENRVTESMNRLLAVDQPYLPSYHLEVTGYEPNWNKETKQVEKKSMSVKADVDADTIHLTQSSTTGDKTDTSEGYIVNGGLGKSEQGGKEYQVTDGKLTPALAFSLNWVALPLQIGMPLIVAGQGAKPAGSEAVDGRAADKFDVDTANLPTGAMGILGGLISITAAKGTAWVDKETGALLKMNIDFSENLYDQGSGNKTPLGKGDGHYDLMVTGVGKTKVTVPPVQEGSDFTFPTSAPEQAAATPTAAPAAKAAMVGDRTPVGGVTLTVSKAEVTPGTEAYTAEDGKTFVEVTVTIENTSNERQYIDYSQFELVDPSSIVYDDIQNGYEKSVDFSPDILKDYELEPGGKLANKVVLVQVDAGATKGLSLLYHFDDANSVKVDLGL